MSKTTVLELLDLIAESVVFIDPDTPAGFATVATDLATLAGRLADDGHQQESVICVHAAHLADGLAKGLGDPVQAIRILIAGLDALRSSLSRECHPEDAGFPLELSNGAIDHAEALADDGPATGILSTEAITEALSVAAGAGTDRKSVV